MRPQESGSLIPWRETLAWAALVLLGLFCIDALIFRTGLYGRVISPESSAGSVKRVIQGERGRQFLSARRVVIFGDSQMGEGFSLKIAIESLASSGIDMSTAAIPGSTPRDWYYILRDLDPTRARYNVIVLPIHSYGRSGDDDSMAERLDDLDYVIGNLKLRDLATFPLSFPSWSSRWSVFRGSLFKGIIYRRDLRDFLVHPRQRIELVKAYREHGWGWGYAYTGRNETLVGLKYDPVTTKIDFPPTISPNVQELVRSRLAAESALHKSGGTYLKRWLNAIEQLYQGRDVRFVLVRMPQYPLHISSPIAQTTDPESIISNLSRDPRNIVIEEHTFDWLERPDYFFDGLHMNRAGREAFSLAFARELKGALKDFTGSSPH